MTAYLCVRCSIPAALEEELPDLVSSWPVLGSQVEDSSRGESLVRVYLSPGDGPAADELAWALEASGGRDVVCEEFAEEDWLAEYRARAKPFAVGRLWWLDPHPGDPTPAPPGRVRLAVEPRSAFGSGSHQSTQLILLELEEMAGGHAPLEAVSVLDVGAGSGILALAADRLGSTWVVGVDVDREAVWVARQTALQQEWRARPHFVAGSVSSFDHGRFKLILCNMISESFLPLLSDLRRLLDVDGQIVFSGLLVEQRVAIQGELAKAGLRVTAVRRLDEWLCLRATMVPA